MGNLFGSGRNDTCSYERATVFTPAPTNYYNQQTIPRVLESQGWRQSDGWQQSRTQAATRNERHSVRIVDSFSRGRKANNHYTGLITMVLRCPETKDWASADYNIQTVRMVQILSISNEYQVVSRLFKTTNKKWYKITRIDRIQNPYLMCAFLLKQEELKNRLGYPPEVLEVFHGTKLISVQSICENNFDWRRHGEHVGARYGKGVSFSPFSHYATYYSDNEKEGKVMLLVKVLVGKKCPGQQGMTVPLPGFDTTEKDNGHVIVKYEDNEFYPAYKITYDFTGNFNPKSKGKRHVNMNINHNFY